MFIYYIYIYIYICKVKMHCKQDQVELEMAANRQKGPVIVQNWLTVKHRFGIYIYI